MAKFTDEQLLNFMNDNDQLLNDVASGKVDVQSVTKDKLKLGSLEAGWGEVLSSIPGQAGRQLQSQGAGVAQMALEDGGSLVDTGDGVSGAITRGLSPDANPFAPLTRAVKTIFGNDVVDKSAESVADYRADIQERMRQERPFIPETMSPKGIMYEGTTGVLPSAAAGVTTYALTRNPQLAAVASGLPSVGDYYGQGRDDNLTPNEASKRASVLGGLELATGQVPIVRALEPTAGTGLVKGLGKAYAEEGIQEAVTQAAELGYDATMHDKNISFADAARQIRDAGVIGGFGGAFMHGAGRGINKIAPKGQPKTDENQPVQSTGEVSQEANDLTQTPVEPNLDQPAYMRSGVFDPESMRLTGEDMPVSTAKTPEQLIQEQMAGGNAGMTPQELSSQNALYEAEQLRQEREALNQQLSDQRQQQYEQAVSQRDAQQEEEAKKPLYTQQNAPVGLNEQQQVDFYRDRDRQFGSLGNAELGQTPKNEAKNIKKRLAQQGSIEATPHGQQPKPEVEQFGIQQNPAMAEAFQQAQGNTNVIQKPEQVEQPKPKTKAEKRNETAVALDVAKKKSGESTTQFEERLDKVSEIYKDISSRQENGTFEDLSRDELADIAKQVGAKVLKKDTRASLRTRVSNWHGSVETKRNARQAQRTAAEEVGTLINNNADVPLEKLKEWQKNYNEANRTKAKTQVDTSVPDVYSGGDVEISLALGLDKVPAPDSQTRKDNPAFRDMDELMKASDGGDINKYIEDAGIRDQVEDYLVAVENNINPTDRDGGITEALGLPKDSNVKRLVAESIFSRKNDILEKADQKILSSMRTRRDTTNRDKAEETKVSAGIIKANRERETEAMGKARSLPLNEALDAVGTYEHTSVPNVTNMLMRKGLTEQEAIDRAKRIKQRGMIDSLVADKVGLKESEELKRQWDDQDFSRDPVEQTKEFLASREQEGNTDVVPMQEYEWAMPNGDESDIVRYNQESGEFERKYGDNSWSEINKRQAKRFLKDVGLNSPEGYGVKSANRSVVEETDESLAAQAEAERKYTAQIEKKQKQSANRKKREIKKKQESDQVGLFNNADKAMDYARQWELTETHYPDVEGESVRRQNAKDWTLRKMPTDKLPNGYIATMFRDPVGKWGDRYFITGDNLKALEPYAAQHWGGKNYKFQLAPKWATDRGVDLAKGEKVLNVPRDSKFLVKLQDAGAYIDTNDYSAMDALDTEQKGKTQESPNFTGTDLQEAARLTVSGYRLAEQNMEVWKHQRWLGELDSNLNRVVRERGVEGNFSQNDLGKTIGVTTENMQELRKVIESEGTQGDVVLARKLFPETARKRDAGEKIQLKPYFPQYIPKTERPNTPEIGDAMVVVSANNPRGVKRKYSTADRFYVESFDGDVVTAVSRFDNDKIKLKKASETTWNVVSRSENLKVVARLDKASPTLETSRKDLRKRWMAENSTESNTNVLHNNKVFPSQEGDEATVYTSNGEEVPVRYMVVEASELQTSNNTDFSVNENFPEELQPRDRSSAALQQQVREIASDLKPERLAESSEADRGAPIVRNGVVESGNGRTIAIKMAYEQGNGKKYKKWLSDHQNRFGIEGVDLFKQPVLVRERLGSMDSREFVVAANEQATAELSTLEQAQVDAGRLTDADLELINIPDSGDMLSSSNHRFMQRFMQRLGTAQSSGLTTADGTFNKAAGERALNAVFHKAYNNDTLTQMVAEESNPEVKNVLTALTRSAPSMVNLQTYEQGDVGLSDALANATMTVRQSRKNGQSVEELIGQADIFSERNPIGDKLAAFIDKNIRSAKRMGDVFTSLSKQIENSHKRSQNLDMFGDSSEVSITDVLQSNTEFVNANTESKAAQGTLDLQQGSKPVRPVSKQGDQPSKQQEGQRAKTNPVAKDYGKENKVFTEDAAEKARALLKSKLGTVHSGIDPEIIQAGITLAGYHIEAGARKFSDYARAMINDLGDGSKPFLRSWYEGVRYYPNFDSKGMSSAAEIDAINVDELGGEDVPSTELDTERNSGNAEQEVREPAVSEPVQAERGRKTESVVDSTRTALEKRDERQSRNSVSENQPDSDGAGSDSKLHNDDGTTGIKSSVTRPNQSERSDGTDGQRNVVKSDGETATSSSTDRPVPSREERVRLQKEAESKSTKEGDLENIRETLPILLPEQQEDVHFAEKRFSEKGHGVHFANGTGTGKTFSGLGIVKRHQREGKNNILVVTPSNEINKEWFNAAPLFNMDIKALESKSDAGEGVVITTYANFRDNWELGKRDWDLLVMDESHNLLQKDSTEPTSALATLRALSGHPKGINRLNSLLNPEIGKPYEEYKSKYDKNVKEIDALEAIKVLSKIEKEKLADLKRANISLKEKMEPLAQELYKKLPETRKVAEKRWDKNQTKTVMLSATPWSYRKSVSLSEGFLFDYPDIEPSGAYNSANSEQQFFIDTFGYQMKHNKLNEPDAKVDTGFLEREFNEKLKEAGSLRARVLEVEYDYDRKFELVDGGIGSKIDDGFAYLRQKQRDLSKAIDGDKVGTEEHTAALARKKAFDKLYNRIVTDFDYQQQIYLLEAIKAKAAVPYIKEHLDRGRKVVVFHGYNKGLEPNVDTGKGVQYRPFYVNEASELDPEILSAWNELKEDRPDMAELAIDDLTKPIDTLSKAFGDKAAFVNGIVSKKVAQKGISDFNKDGSGTDVIVVQQDKGSAGISLHDKTGKHQRVLINLGIPVKPTQSIQIEGRIYRVNLMSDALFRYFNTGLNFERRMFASRMATRAGTTENLAMGNSARALKDNMIEAFEDSQSWGVGFDGEGVGGKSADRQSNTDVTQWDRAKSLYYTQQKKTSATKAQEGKDYFATPEPVGLKMVEWLGLNKGDKVLEPSAGHGAISRWFPDGVFGHVVEPSNYLFPKAQMATNNLDKAHNIEFEEFGTNNKFNGIAMNPPYGKGGKVAMEHLSKAFQHLRRGGRVVALVPEGPAFQKRFDAWIEGQPTANHVATIHLPDSTFKRAGTSVSTKIVAIDYIPKGIPKEQSHHDVDLTSEKDVDDLFNRIEEMEIPPRQEIADIDVDEVMSDANLEVKKRRASKNTPAVWAVTGNGTYRYREAIKASSAIEDKKPRFNGAKRSWDFAEENGNPSEAIAENVLKLQRGELDVSYSVTNELPSRSIDPRAAELEVNKFLKKYRGAAGVKVRVVKTQNEVGGLPPRVQKLVQAAYNHSTGEVTIIAENIKSNRQLQQILRHEVIAHHGLQNLMSEKDFDQFLTDVIASNHPVIRSAWDEVNGRYPNESTKHKAEEVIALLSERQPKGITNVIQRALTTLTKWLRKVGLARADLTSGEVFNVLDGIEKGFQSGTPTYDRTRSGVSFSASSSNSGITSEKDLDQVFAPVHEQSPLKDRVSDWWDKFRASFRQKTVDRYDALKKLDREVMHDGDEMSDVTRSSWVLAKMAGAANGVIEATMGYGRMRYDAADKSFKPVSENDASGGFIGFMQSIGDKNEINAFLRWVAGERANQINKKADKAAAQASKTRQKIAEIDNAIDTLAWDKSNPEQSLMLREIKMQRKELAASLKDLEKKASVRERFLREQDIAGALALIEKGDRRERFQKHYETFKAYQNDFVDAGVATGVISKDAADMWRDEFYMPFYRVMKEDNETGAPVRPSGLSRQEAYKRFKGANIQVGDLLNNVIQNFSAITSASLKNQAAVQAMDNAMEAGVASETTESKRNKKASTWVMRDGKKVWYNVDDPLLFDAISSLDPVQLNFFGFKTAAKFKSAFTDIVTLSPKFILRNYIRDVFQTQATSTDVTLKSIYDSAKYVFNDIGKMNHEKALMLSTGASFTFAGNYAETSIDDVSGTANSLKKINSPEDAKKFAGKALEGYRALANNVENANRSAVFKAAKEAGKSDLEAAFNARDLMDFGSHGSNTTIRALVSIVPFLNARIQGLDKLSRTNGLYNAIAMKTQNATEKQLAKRFWLVSGLLISATIALYAVNVGDPENEEEYRKLTNEQRDLNWYVGGFLIPKPHEIGAFFITPAERMMDELVYDRAEDGALRNYASRTFLNTFSFNPTPQIVKPMVELYMNKNMFTDRPIEMEWEQGNSKRSIYDHRTSSIAKGSAEAMAMVFGDSFLSPKQIDHLIYGYTGWIGKTASDMVDMAVNEASDNPKPATYFGENPVVKAFVGGLYVDPNKPRYTQDQKRLYDLTQDIHRDFKDYQELIKLGNEEQAREMVIKKGQRLRLHKFALKANRNISKLNLRKKAIRQSTTLTAKQKREQIDHIQYVQSQISKNAIKVLNAAGIK